MRKLSLRVRCCWTMFCLKKSWICTYPIAIIPECLFWDKDLGGCGGCCYLLFSTHNLKSMQEESVIPTANKVIIIYAPKIIAHNQIEVQQIAPIFLLMIAIQRMIIFLILFCNDFEIADWPLFVFELKLLFPINYSIL